MDERSASPEIDVVGYSDRSGLLRSQSESFSTWTSGSTATALHAANQNGAKRLAANTNTKANKAETVNLRVRNMGKITVKKEPESDEDCEVSYSLSSLLQECDFEQAPRAKTRALKSPTSLAIAKSKSMEAARSLTGRSRQTLENVISSLKSARSTDTNQPKFAKKPSGFQNPVVPISMPSQIVSVAPTAQSTVSFPGSGVVTSGPQIVDVRSLATGVQTALSGAAVRDTRSTTSKPVPLRPLHATAVPNTRLTALSTGHTAKPASNLPVTTAQAAVSRVPSSTIKISSASGPKPLNIRFVLPATEPFNTSEFQQILQTALATVISQSKGVDASLLQQAIQAALTTVTKTAGPLTAYQLQQAIQSSLAALSVRPIPQVTPASLTQAPGLRVLQPLQKQPQALAPMPPQLPLQSTSRTGDQISSATSVVPSVSTGPQIVTNASSLVTNGGNQLASGVVTSLAVPLNLNQSPLNSARDALIKALQEKRVLNSPPSLSSSSLSSTSEASPSVTVPESIDEPFSGSPPSSPVLPTPEKPAENSTVPDKSQAPTSAILNTTCAAKTVRQTTTVTNTARTPLIVLRSGTYLKPNQSPVNSGTQTASIKMPVQVQASQGNSLPAAPVMQTFTPQTTSTTVNLISQTNSSVQSTVPSLPASKVPPVMVPTQLVQFSVAPVTSSNTPVTKTESKTAAAAKPKSTSGTTVNLPSQTNSSVQSTVPSLPASKVSPVMVPTQLVQFSVAPVTSSNTPVTQTESKSAAAKPKSTSGGFCAGGCCIYCRTCHENNNICGLPTCQKAFPNRAALRKHYHFNPTHKYIVPMEKSSIACDNFLPLEIADSHRKARLRELFRRLPDDEFLDLVMPRVAKMLSLFQLLEQKSQRVQAGGISAFKMFTEFERFRREVEAKLLELILLPQGKDKVKGSKRRSKNGSKPTDAKTSDADNSSQGDQAPPGADKQGSKDSMPSDAANTADQKLESSTAQPKTDTNPNVGSSETAKNTVDTICLDSDVEKSTTRTSDTEAGLAACNQDGPSIGAINNDTTVEEEKASDSPLSEEKSEESGKESSDLNSTSLVSSKVSPVKSFPSKDGEGKEGEPSEQSSSLPQSVEANCESAESLDGKSGADQPSEQPKQTENVGHISDESTPKDSTSVTMEIDDSSKALQLQSSDVIMVEDQSETKSCSNDEELKSRREEKAGEAEKPIHVIDLVSKEDNAAVDANAEKNSEAGRSVIESADATQEDKITEKPDGANEIVAMDVEEERNNFKIGSEKGQAKESTVQKRDEVGNEVDCAKITSDERGTVRDDDQTEKSKMDLENQAKECQQQESTKSKADGSCEGGKVETINVDNDSDMTTASTSKETLDVSMVTDKPDSDVSKDQDANTEKTSLEKDSDQVKEVPKSSNKDEGTNPESTKDKITQECRTDTDNKVNESRKVSSSEVASSSGNTVDSSDATSAGTSNSGEQTGSDTVKKKRKFITLEDLDLGEDDDDEDGMDETNMLDFSLPFAVKWGRIIQKVRSVEAKKIARKENYSEQDMKQFIYNKPKDAANAVIIADCHAHPSFFRAYVMPALLDKHIDDFGLFGKKLLSRLVLPRQKYVQILRNGIGPELAKILGINIFPTFKRIQDTWTSVRNPLGTTSRSSSSKPVITIDAADDVDIPDDDNEAATANKAVRPINNSQNTADKAKDSLKRPGPADSVENDNNKRLRVDNTDSLKDVSQTKESDKGQTENSAMVSQKDGSQPNEASKGKKPAEPGGSIKDTQDNKIQAEERNKDQTGKLNSAQTSAKTVAPVINLETEKAKSGATSSTSVPVKETTLQPVVDEADAPDTDSVVLMSVDEDPKSSDVAPKEATTSSVAVAKPPCSTISAKTPPTSSCSTAKPSTSVGDTSAKTCASSIIPAKATIYTTGGGKKGASSVPLPTTKGSPLFLVPVERISPKLVEQYIQQGKGDGMKTRSSDKKKAKKPKQGSQVLVLIPSSNPNGSPTIQTLTSAEQLESTGDKKPLLLLPADKVPKSIASQSQTVRRKMVITMVAPSSGAATGTKSKPSSTQNVSATSTSSGAAGQSGEPTSAVQSVKGPIMSTQEGKANTASTKSKSDSGTPDTGSGSSASVDSTAKSLASVVNNTSALNVSSEDTSAASKQSASGSGLTDGDNADSQGAAGSKGSNSQSDEVPSSDTTGDSLKESSTDKEPGSNKETIEDGDSAPAASEGSTSAAASGGDVGGSKSTSSNTELDLLGSSVLPSDLTLDSLLKDIEEDGSGDKANEMPPLDVSEIIRSFEDLPVESDSSTAADSSLFDTGGDANTVGDSSEGSNDIHMASSIQDRSSLQDEHSYAQSRRQSPRRTPASSKPASGSSTPDVSDTEHGLRKTSSPSGAKEDSDVDEGSPPRKRRKAPTRTSARSSPQVTFVPDKVAPGKSPQSSSAKAKGRK